jgi:hypothetical protein
MRVHPSATFRFARSFHTSSPRLTEVLPARKPVGAFRGGFVFLPSSPTAPEIAPTYLLRQILANTNYSDGRLLGFFVGATLAGTGVSYYVLNEYKVSNDLLTEDIYVRVCI